MLNRRHVLNGVAALCVAGCATAPRSAAVAPAAQPVTATAPAPAPVLAPPPASVSAPAPSAAVDPARVARGFDLLAYRADPAAYCRIVDGSRYMQVAEPGPGVPVVTAIGAGALTMQPGERVRVQVQTDPGMPVHVSSQGLGKFEASGQSSVTVPADAQGVATIEFFASGGTVGHCLLIAGSPVRAGQVQFLITIREH